MIWWRMPTPGVLLTSVVGPPELVETALARDKQGCVANRCVVRHWVPYGATGWSDSPAGPWRPLSEFPGFGGE